MSSPRKLLAIIGLCILAAAFSWSGSWNVLYNLLDLDPFALIASTLGIIAATLLGAYNVFRIGELGSFMTFTRFLPIFWRSWAIGITMPGQIADMPSTIWQLRGQRAADLAFIGGRLIVDKLISLTNILALVVLLAAALSPPPQNHWPWFLSASVVILISAPILAHVLASQEHGNFLLHQRVEKLLALAKVPPLLALENVAVTLAKLAITGLSYWLIFRSMSQAPPSYVITTLVTQSAGLVAYIPISFNGLGTVEVSAIALFSRLNQDASIILTVYLVMRTLTMTVAWTPVALISMRPPPP